MIEPTDTHSFTASDIRSSILSRFAPSCFTMPKFRRQLLINFLWSFHCSPSAQIIPGGEEKCVNIDGWRREWKILTVTFHNSVGKVQRRSVRDGVFCERLAYQLRIRQQNGVHGAHTETAHGAVNSRQSRQSFVRFLRVDPWKVAKERKLPRTGRQTTGFPIFANNVQKKEEG